MGVGAVVPFGGGERSLAWTPPQPITVGHRSKGAFAPLLPAGRGVAAARLPGLAHLALWVPAGRQRPAQAGGS